LLERGASCSDSFEAVWIAATCCPGCVFAHETCGQEEVREFKGVTFKIGNYKPPFGRTGQSLQPCYASRMYATEHFGASVRSACTSRYRLPTVAINIARARHKMYPVSSPIGLYGPYGPAQRLQGLEWPSVRTTESACASQTADPLPELRAVLLFRPCQASIFLGVGTYGASFSALSGPLRELDACRAINLPLLHTLPLILIRCIIHSMVLTVLQNFRWPFNSVLSGDTKPTILRILAHHLGSRQAGTDIWNLLPASY